MLVIGHIELKGNVMRGKKKREKYDDFMDKVWDKAKPSRLTRFKRWCSNWTDEEISYLIGWVFILYLMIGVIKYQPSILNVILWPFI